MAVWIPSFPEFANRPSGCEVGDLEPIESGDRFKIKDIKGNFLPYPWIFPNENSEVHSFGYESQKVDSPFYNKLAAITGRSILTVRFKPKDGKPRTRYAYFYTDDAIGFRHFQAMKSASDPADIVKNTLIQERVLYERSA